MKKKVFISIGVVAILAYAHSTSSSQEKCTDALNKIKQTYGLNISVAKAEEILKNLDERGVLPNYYVTEDYARENCDWAPGKKLWGFNPCNKKILGGDRYIDRHEKLPASQRWRTADIDYSGGQRNPERLLYVPGTKSRYITPDEYESFIPIPECTTKDEQQTTENK